MSEQSESFHLRSDSIADAVGLLERAAARGFVFPPRAGWVAFVCGALPADAPAVRPDLPPEIGAWMALQAAHKAARARVTRANTSLLLHYEFAEDHGCVVRLLEGPEVVGRVEVSFESGEVVFDEAAFVTRGVLTSTSSAALRRWLGTAATFHERQTQLLEAGLSAPDERSRGTIHARYLDDRYRVGRALGLGDIAWLTFDGELEGEAGAERVAVGIPST